MERGRYLVEARLREGRSVAEHVATHGVHRSWLYQLLAPYRRQGDVGLQPRSSQSGQAATASSRPTAWTPRSSSPGAARCFTEAPASRSARHSARCSARRRLEPVPAPTGAGSRDTTVPGAERAIALVARPRQGTSRSTDYRPTNDTPVPVDAHYGSER